MSPDLHPEELLDKSAAGTLTPQEAEHLKAHLASCAACRFEQKARADFALAPAATLDVDNLVSRALAGMPTQARFAPKRRVPVVLAAAVALFTVASFAAVGQVTGMLPALVDKLSAPPPAPEGAAPIGPLHVRPRPAPVEAQPAPAPEPEITPEPVPETAPTPVPAPVLVRTTPAAKHAAPIPHDDAPVLFLRGNAARIRGDRAEAALAYRELLAKFPDSDEARLTHATLGRMLLDGGDAQGALIELDAYLQSGDGTLREEVMTARAAAFSALNRHDDEAAAWSALLQRYPDSVHAARAKARLDELKAP
jgi:TolA-binding protein